MTEKQVDVLHGYMPETKIGELGPSLAPQNDSNAADKMNTNLNVYKNKMKDGKRAIVRLKRKQEDGQLNAIISDLLLLESSLRKEQSQILSQLSTRDATITVQRQEIERLRRDNRRLISRLKKITEGRGDARDGKPCAELNQNNEGSGEIERKTPTKKSAKGSKRLQDSQHHHHQPGFVSNRPFVKQSVMTPLASQFYEKSTLQFTDENGKVIDRVLHKPPIAEKPKLSVARVSARPVTAIVRSIDGQCNIVSTISRLLDEESDQGINGSSGSSEPSSPEATLKPTTPRVIRLARQYEKGLVVANSSSASDSGRESGRSGDEQSIKALVMDEYEVTSGYNSDAVSDQDHDYENVVLFQGGQNAPNEDEEEDNYVILRAVKDEQDNTLLVENPEDQHIYSNIEYARDGLVATLSGDAKEALLRQLLETDLDSSECLSENELSESPKRASNIPRSRQNINLVIGSEESHLMDNFEEFLLDSLDLEEDLNEDEQKLKQNAPSLNLRLSGDGAEAKNPAPREQKDGKTLLPGQGGYEKFLEVTGLSQKSILTPSRMFSNHRSVLKPRDIKHRDKLRAAFTTLSTLEEGSSTSVSPTQSGVSSQRYWREPYL